ncbi:hypothetical protein OV760_27680, partial [Salmonella enterica subsp. enterica serovar 1,4,[5],12:i:-]|nr:hypothetical protein [Salmonella enterica subsp. enterica serovar 1,4,[5],12:i:-]
TFNVNLSTIQINTLARVVQSLAMRRARIAGKMEATTVDAEFPQALSFWSFKFSHRANLKFVVNAVLMLSFLVLLIVTYGTPNLVSANMAKVLLPFFSKIVLPSSLLEQLIISAKMVSLLVEFLQF